MKLASFEQEAAKVVKKDLSSKLGVDEDKKPVIKIVTKTTLVITYQACGASCYENVNSNVTLECWTTAAWFTSGSSTS